MAHLESETEWSTLPYVDKILFFALTTFTDLYFTIQR